MSLVALMARSFLFGIDLFVKISKMGMVGMCRWGGGQDGGKRLWQVIGGGVETVTQSDRYIQMARKF